MGSSDSTNKRIVILGFDGLSPSIVETMMKQNKLPNFSKLKDQGGYSLLETTNPAQSPVAWSGFATGKNPGKHGIYDFIVRNPKNYGLKISLSEYVKGKPVNVKKAKSFWQYASDKNITSVLLGTPVTFPPDKIKGKILAGMGVPDLLGTEGTFTFYTTESQKNDKAIGGKVFSVPKSNSMTLNLIGPKVMVKGKPDHTKVPFQINLNGKKEATIKHSGKTIKIKTGEWSDWQEVSFKLGFLKKAKGIFKFYLSQVKPHLKLYISPINFDPRDQFMPVTHPKSYGKELVNKIGLFYTQGMPMDTWAVNELRLMEDAFIEQAGVVLKEKKAMLDYEMKNFKSGILMGYFESPDIIQHMFWRYIDTQHPQYKANQPQAYRTVIYDWYQKMDSILGDVMSNMSEENDIIIVMSDHGMDTFRRSAHINSWLKENGYLFMDKDHKDADGEFLIGIDWSKTKAYSLGFGAIYINQEGRDQKGSVKPGEETDALKEEISKKLMIWTDAKNKQKIINKVYDGTKIFWGDYANEAPDLFIGFKLGYRASWQTALGAAPKGLIEDNLKKWSGTHLNDPALVPGVFFTNKKIAKEDVSILDIAPTVLSHIGYNNEELVAIDFDGKPIF